MEGRIAVWRASEYSEIAACQEHEVCVADPVGQLQS